MDMCYDGALVLPSSYAVMNEEEMTYLEGGAKKLICTISATQCNRLAAQTAIAGGLITLLCGITTIISASITYIPSVGTGTAAALAIGGGITTAAAGITCSVSGYLWLASTYKGLKVYYNTSTKRVYTQIKK